MESNNYQKFKCPGCGRVSNNPRDVEHQYCGACKRFWDATALKDERIKQELSRNYVCAICKSPGGYYCICG